MTENRQGQVVTFYSFKGGTGRTMALANVAWILAANGYRVLVADWDLESPGLHRFFHPFIDARQLENADGVIDLIREYEWASTAKEPRGDDWYKAYAKVSRYALSLTAEFPGDGGIDLLAAGVQRLDYAKSVYSIDWDTFHDQLNGGRFLDALRDDMKANYDFALIDSRTGFSDVADICTIHLPDTLVDCFTYSSQGVEGAAQVANAIRTTYGARQIRILPVPMRVDPAEKAKEDLGRALAMRRFLGLPSDMSDQERVAYWASVAVPYYAFYAYEETLATFADEPGSPRSMLYAYETLTRFITQQKVTGLPPMERSERERIKAKFERASRKVEGEIVLRYQPADQVWAEWVEDVLRMANVRVFSSPGAPQGEPQTAREMRIVSARNEQLGSVQVAPPRGEHPLMVLVDNVRPSHASAPETYQLVNNLAEPVAVQRILELVGRAGEEAGEVSVRYPGAEPIIFKAPAHNSHFTGREEDLLRLRQQLLGGKGRIAVISGAVATVSLQGMGGIGKTWLALEYAYRYRSAYDIVWWVRSDPPAFVDTELADLGRRLGLLSNQPQPNAAEMVKATLRALERGEPHRRWLVIFDNAEDIERIGPFLPRQGGHLLITSRDPAWSDHSQRMTLDVFRREESISHLHSRIPTIKLDEADGVAAMLGDLPIAVAAAAAWLADTGTAVRDYLHQLEEQGPNDPSVEKTWDLSLERLRERSPAAFRLFQLCSVMGPEIHTDLIYSDRMAEALARFDPTVVDRQVRGRLVQQINKLALLKVDVSNSQLLVHRVVQSVVRARMTEQEQSEARHEVHRVLAAARPGGEIDDASTWRRYQQLWPHLDISKAVECNDEEMRELLIARVRFLYLATGSDADHAEAKNLAERVEDTWQGQLAVADDQVARNTIRRQLLHMRFNLANIIRETGGFTRSHQLDQETHAEQVQLLTAQHPHTLMTAGGLAADLRALGRYAEALDRDQITYDAWAEYFGLDHTRTLAALNNLATSHRHMGNYGRAQALVEEVWRRRRVVSGETHTATLVTASNLGRDYREAGEYESSVELLRRTLDQLQRTYGDDYRTTLNVQANLAVSLRSAGAADEAGELLDMAYTRLIDTAGQTAPDTLACRLSRAVNLLALATARNDPSDVQRSMTELELVRDGFVAFVGHRHPHTLLCVNNLAAVARAAGLLDQAHEFATEAAGVLTEVLGPQHPYTLAARMNLGICQAEMNKLVEAIELMQEVAELLAVVLGPEHPDTVRCRANVVLGQLSLGLQHAEKTHARVLAQLTERLGAEHPAVRAMQERRYLHRIVEPHPF